MIRNPDTDTRPIGERPWVPGFQGGRDLGLFAAAQQGEHAEAAEQRGGRFGDG